MKLGKRWVENIPSTDDPDTSKKRPAK